QESLLAYGISVPCGSALLAMARLGEGVSQGVLATEMGIEPATLVRNIDLLAKAGLVTRQKGVPDARVKTLWFTGQGRGLVVQIEQALSLLRAKMLSEVSEQELASAIKVFRMMADYADSRGS
ncbi:MarR family transcriptional regulator, partial [Pseudomonas putida]|nr:MarR family transcriptional regulator [Pseudomonas putida]